MQNVSRYFLHLFSAHYPERLGRVYMVAAPWYFHAVYRLLRPFIAEETQRKVRLIGGGDKERAQALLADIANSWRRNSVASGGSSTRMPSTGPICACG